MGMFFDRFKKQSVRAGQQVQRTSRKMVSRAENHERDPFKKSKFSNPHRKDKNSLFEAGGEYNKEGEFNDENFEEPFEDNERYDDFYDETRIQPSQKPESFHHFILDNQYKDLERSIRGVKEVWDKTQDKWVTKRKDFHCFTTEEAEDILRTAQSHLSTDIKLGRIPPDAFGAYMMAIYKEVAFLFETIAEYRYGRYEGYELQYKMKAQNQKIFLELMTRIQANYSRSIGGQENKFTHDSVKGQESLQQTDRDLSDRRYM